MQYVSSQDPRLALLPRISLALKADWSVIKAPDWVVVPAEPVAEPPMLWGLSSSCESLLFELEAAYQHIVEVIDVSGEDNLCLYLLSVCLFSLI